MKKLVCLAALLAGCGSKYDEFAALARKYAAEHDWTNAHEYARKAREARPDSDIVREIREAESGFYIDQAITLGNLLLLQKAREAMPDGFEARATARMLDEAIKKRDWPEADRMAESLKRLDPAHPKLAGLKEARRNEARRAIEAKDFERAARILRDIEDPELTEQLREAIKARDLEAFRAALARHDFAEARRVGVDARQVDRAEFAYCVELARRHIAARNWDRARAQIDRAQALGDASEIREALGRAERQEHLDRAREALAGSDWERMMAELAGVGPTDPIFAQKAREAFDRKDWAAAFAMRALLPPEPAAEAAFQFHLAAANRAAEARDWAVASREAEEAKRLRPDANLPIFARTDAWAGRGKPAWRFEAGGDICGLQAVWRGHVCFGSTDDRLYIVSPDGKEYREFKTSAAVRGDPVILGNMLYAADSHGNLLRVNLETMKGDSVKVEHTAPDSLAAGSGLLFACTSWNVAAIDPQAGHVVWQKQMRPIFDPAVCGHGVLVVDEDHRLWALDPKSGQVLWSVDDVDQPPVAVGERVIAAHRMGQKHVVRAYDSKGGRLWEVNAGSTTSRPAAEPGRLYFRTQEGSVFVVDAAGGQVVKKFKSDDDWATDPAVVNGVVYVGSYRKMLALDTRSEKVVWTYEALEPVHAPCVAGGRVYFGSEDRHVYAVWAGDPDADGWPCYRGNAQRTASK